MRDDVASCLLPGQVVHITAVVCERYDGRGALLLEVKEKNCAQRFWFPTIAVVEQPDTAKAAA